MTLQEQVHFRFDRVHGGNEKQKFRLWGTIQHPLNEQDTDEIHDDGQELFDVYANGASRKECVMRLREKAKWYAANYAAILIAAEEYGDE